MEPPTTKSGCGIEARGFVDDSPELFGFDDEASYRGGGRYSALGAMLLSVFDMCFSLRSPY